MKGKFIYYATSLLAGYLVMSLEILGFRLLAPFFGYSLYVFGSLIGLILFALALGYLWGGRLGDKNVGLRSFMLIFFCGALYLLLVSLGYAGILEIFSGLDIITGALFATFGIFFVPMVILASLSPYFIKILAVDQNQGVGFSAGRISSIGTLGSLAGTFLTAFYFIPELGARLTLYIDTALMFLIPIFFLGRTRQGYLLLTLPLLLLVGVKPANYPGVIYETDSVYNHLEIADYGDFLGLRVDRRSGIAYSFFPQNRRTRGFLFYDLFQIPPLVNGAKTSLLLGLGAGNIPRLHDELGQGLRITGVEIDPKIIDLGYSYFELGQIKNLNIVIEDVRPFLRHTEEKYDLIEIDLFWGGGELPFYLATREFFELTKSRLSPKGIVSMNIYDPSDDQKILAPILNTIAAVYPKVYLVEAGLGSHFAMAALNDLDYQKLNAGDVGEELAHVIGYFKNNIKNIAFDVREAVFTDDLAPLEKLTYQAIFKDL